MKKFLSASENNFDWDAFLTASSNSNLSNMSMITRSCRKSTKWHDTNQKINKDPIDCPISLPNYEQMESRRTKEFCCRWCNHLLYRILDSSGQNPALYCNNCAISYDTEEDTNDLRSKSKLEPSHHNVEPSVSYPPDPNTSFAKKEVESKGAFAQLNKRGTLRIIDYTETGGSGKILGKKSKR